MAEGEKLLTAIGDQGARLPSQRRFEARRRSMSEGIALSGAEMAQLDRFETMGLGAPGA